MKNFVKYIVIASFLLIRASHMFGNQSVLPDSIITIEHTYQYCLTDPVKAQQIMDELMRRKQDKSWELDWCQGDLYYNMGKYKLAILYFEKALSDKEVSENPRLRMGLLSTMMECYRMNNSYDKIIECAVDVLKIAKEQQDNAEMGRAYLFMGKELYRQGKKEQGFQYLTLGEECLKESEDVSAYFYFNLSLANLLVEDNQYESALTYARRCEEGIEQMCELEDMPEDYCIYEQCRLNALMCEILEKNGKKKEAGMYYRKFIESSHGNDTRNRIHIVPYLLSINDYNEAIAIARERVDFLKNKTDSIGDEMLAATYYLVESYEKSGNADEALYYSKRINALKDSLRNRDRANTALELATIYDVQVKDMQISEQKNALYIHNILFISSCVVLGLLLVIIIIVVRNMRRTKDKNKAMVRQIEEMLYYQKRLEQLHAKIWDEDLQEEGNKVIDTRNLDEGEIFMLLEQRMIKEKLYLNPDLTRDDMIDLLSVRRQTFIKALKEYANMSFTDYINSLRLDEALHLLKMSGEANIDIIAEQSGFGSVRSFYRQFKEKYGMSPSEYRKQVKADG